MSESPKMPAEFSGHKCPKCGSTLLTDGQYLWCSFVGGDNQRGCDYGIVGDLVPVVMYDPDPPKCKSCGVPYVDHLGIQGTCKQLQDATKRMDSLREKLRGMAISGHSVLTVYSDVDSQEYRDTIKRLVEILTDIRDEKASA